MNSAKVRALSNEVDGRPHHYSRKARSVFYRSEIGWIAGSTFSDLLISPEEKRKMVMTASYAVLLFHMDK